MTKTEDIKELMISPGWELIKGRMEREQHAMRELLLRANDMDDVRRLQAAITAISKVLDLPRQIIKEEELKDGQREGIQR